MPYIYILHFDTPLSHAQHYAGCTMHPRKRLIAHAFGRGARIVKVLRLVGISWRLATLATCPDSQRIIERRLKDTHNIGRYCPICNPDAPRIPGTKSYPLEMLSFPITSSDLLRPTLEFNDGNV